MARAKSTSGKGRNSKAQPDVSTPNGIQDINPGASTELATSGVKPETRNRSDNRATSHPTLSWKPSPKQRCSRFGKPRMSFQLISKTRYGGALMSSISNAIPVRAVRSTIGSQRNAKSCSVTTSRAPKRVLWRCGRIVRLPGKVCVVVPGVLEKSRRMFCGLQFHCGLTFVPEARANGSAWLPRGAISEKIGRGSPTWRK